MISVEEIEKAATAIGPATRRTPLLESKNFQKRLGVSHPVYFKLESLQYTGSFKVRGALNKLLSVQESAKKTGVITASAGNHAQGVAYHSQRLGIQAKIVMPMNTPLVKINSTKQWGADVVLHGESYQEAYEKAVELQKDEGRQYIHAFEDETIMAGQGTIAKEVLEDLPDIGVFVSPIGGGGLLSGCGSYLKTRKTSVKIIGVQAEGCATFTSSLKAGKVVALSQVNTIAEGISAKKMGELSFSICREIVDHPAVVSDTEISEGILWLLENERLFVEGSAAVGIAALMKQPSLVTGPTVVLLSGGNLDVNLLALIIERGLVKSGRLVMLEATISDAPGSLNKLIQVIAEQKASIVQINHERVFWEGGLRDVFTRISLETHGPAHTQRLKTALSDHGYTVKFL